MNIIKNTLLFASVIAVAVTVSGCDFFRSLVGRPTSEWIARKAEMIAADKEFRETIEEITKEEESGQDTPDTLSVTSGYDLPYRYYVVIGVFASHDNARALADRVKAKGYQCVLVDWHDNKLAVTLNPTNDLAVACSSLDAISNESFCPKDAWIMDGNRNRI